jgi:hypothetical protein
MQKNRRDPVHRVRDLSTPVHHRDPIHQRFPCKDENPKKYAILLVETLNDEIGFPISGEQQNKYILPIFFEDSALIRNG